MSRVTIADNMLDPTTWEDFHDVDDISKLLSERYHEFPATGKIYFQFVAKSCDVTPHNEEEVERLGRLRGHFFVMVEPEGLELIAIIVLAVLAVVSITLALLLRNSAKPDYSASPNNSLSERQNTARPNERIPDIVGTVRSVPDEIAVPYRVFEGNQEVEFGYLCVGRGYYQVSRVAQLLGSTVGPITWDIKEDQTFIEQIDGDSVEVYEPYTSPNSGDYPSIRIGTAINQKVINIMKSSSVIGQILRAPNDQTITGSGSSFVCHSDGTLSTSDSNVDFNAFFAIGDYIILFNGDNFTDPSGTHASVDLNGDYQVLAVTTNLITFANPTAVNGGWAALANYGGQKTNGTNCRLTASGSRTIGPYILDIADMTEVWANFVAPNGLFKVSSSSGNQYAVNDTIEMLVQALDESYNPVGAEVTISATVFGSSIIQSQRATTCKFVLPLRTDGKPAGRVQVSAVRISPYDPTWEGTNADEIQWRDLYAVSPVILTDFGNVTTIQTKSYATASALTTQSRKLNLEVTRKLPVLDPITHLQVPAFGMTVTLGADMVIDNGNQLYTVEFAGLIPGVAPTGTVYILFDGTPASSIPANTINPSVSSDISAVGVGTHTLKFIYAGDANYEGFTISASYALTAAAPVGAVPVVVSKTSATNFAPSKNAADIFIALALDPYIGNRTVDEINWTELYANLGVGGVVDTYFGCPYCSQFCYTFDDTQTSFEEMATDMGQAVFCQPYRQGSQLSMFFEEQTDVSTLLFNHRNKLPGTETRTITMGLTSDYDGVSLDYIDPNAPNYPQLETTVTLYFPEDQSAVNPRKVKTVGVRNNVQAKLLGWRLYQKLLYQNTVTEFQATAEAALVINTQRILVADNTRPDTQDGEVVDQSGLMLTLSQPVTMTAGGSYVIFLQHDDETVESIPILPVPNNQRKVLLRRVPQSPLVLDPAMYARTTYQICGPSSMMFKDSGLVFDWQNNRATITGYQVYGDINPGETVTLIGCLAIDPGDEDTFTDVSGDHIVESADNHQLVLTPATDWSFITAYTNGLSKSVFGRISVSRPLQMQATPFLVSEKRANDGMTYMIQASIYDDRYYAHDTDVLAGVLGLNEGGGGSNVGFDVSFDGSGHY
jgi:hypothetical protein